MLLMLLRFRRCCFDYFYVADVFFFLRYARQHILHEPDITPELSLIFTLWRRLPLYYCLDIDAALFSGAFAFSCHDAAEDERRRRAIGFTRFTPAAATLSSFDRHRFRFLF